MKRTATFCDICDRFVKDEHVVCSDGKELCFRCDDDAKINARREIREQNRRNAANFAGCERCKGSGYIHKSIYALGPGYYDEPDPDVFCTCKKGIALNPTIQFLVV